ncbi:MAG: hypothetical protein NT080_07195 [Spirochaetes bacterium]|nr:hypothetical protein [Spirochaetota bacterium]
MIGGIHSVPPRQAGFLAFIIRISCAVAACAATFSGCGKTGDALSILMANSRYSEARYQEAATGYLSVGIRRYGGIVDLDVATAFAALGEEESASELFAPLADSSDPLVASYAAYGLGVIAFGRGEYAEAESRFRESLRYLPGAPDASRGLEAAREAARRTDKARSAARAPSSTARGGGEELLDLVGRLESSRYKPGSASSGEKPGDDL